MEASQTPRPNSAPPATKPQPTPQQDAQLERFSPEERADIYQRAAQIQADTLFRDDETWSRDELAAGARGAGISDEVLQAAIREREADVAASVARAKVEAAQRVGQRKKIAVGAAIAAGIVGLSLLTTQAKLSGAYAQVESTRAQIDNNLQRRHDLVPNLIAVSRKTLNNQSALIEQLKRANDAAIGAAPAQKIAAENELSSAIQAATAQLKESDNASETTRDLVAELAGSENRLAQSRRQFNNAAAQYNQKARGFPTTFVRPLLGYQSRIEPLQADAASREAPKF